MRSDAFSAAHPAVNLSFFLAVTLITAFVLHPVITGISLVLACAYTVYLKGKRALKLIFLGVLPVVIVVAVLNPLFNHAGVTVLFYLKNGNAVTKEAVLYGAVSACMFGALLLWCSCLNSVISSDKYVFLFGGVIPVLALFFSMVLRFVPRFAKRMREVSDAQAGSSPPFGKSPLKAAKRGLAVISATVTWALESAVTTADSMKSRGYGLKGRTSYALYRFTLRDIVLGALMSVLCGAFIVSAASGALRFRFYPSVKYSSAGLLPAMGFAAFALLSALPLLLDLKEKLTWQAISSRI